MKKTSAMPLFLSNSPLVIEQLFNLPRSWLSRRWDGAPSAVSVAYTLAADLQHLHVVAEFPVPSETSRDGSKGEGTFERDLWKGDVFEIFLTLPAGYQEIHLSPSGAWWSGVFVTPRKLLYEASDKLHIRVQRRAQSYNVAVLASFPREMIGAKLDNGFPVSGNLCAALQLQEQLLLSQITFPEGDKADFHQPALFAPFLTLSLNYSPPHK